MTKTGKVSIGKTPSEVSGKTSTQITDGEPTRKGEKLADPELKKLASILKDHDDGQ